MRKRKPPAQHTHPGTPCRQPSDDVGWHLAMSPYPWFAGIHGTVGALGHVVSMHASPGDLLSHYDFGLIGAAAARRKRFLLDGDMMWIRLSGSQAALARRGRCVSKRNRGGICSDIETRSSL